MRYGARCVRLSLVLLASLSLLASACKDDQTATSDSGGHDSASRDVATGEGPATDTAGAKDSAKSSWSRM